MIFRNYPLRDLLTEAYGVRRYEVAGPSWLTDVVYLQSDAFEVAATMATGTTKEQCAIMLQNALTERFNLKVHREDKSVQGYGLTVGSHGSKLERSLEALPNAAQVPGVGTIGKDGFLIMPLEYSGLKVYVTPPPNMVARMKFFKRSMAELAEWLADREVGRPVIDRTGLAGQYTFLLELHLGSPTTTDPSEPAPPSDTIFSVVESTLGLKLVREQCPVKMLVIDHADRMPSAN